MLATDADIQQNGDDSIDAVPGRTDDDKISAYWTDDNIYYSENVTGIETANPYLVNTSYNNGTNKRSIYGKRSVNIVLIPSLRQLLPLLLVQNNLTFKSSCFSRGERISKVSEGRFSQVCLTKKRANVRRHHF